MGKKQSWKPGNMLYPLPAALISVGDENENNLITVAWTGTLCSDPPLTYISVRKSRFSHALLVKHPEFVINLTTEDLARATDFCGVRSGREMDKWEVCGLTRQPGEAVKTPGVAESPVQLECRILRVEELGTHDMFMAEILNVRVDESLLDEKGRLHLEKSRPLVYSHGDYYGIGQHIGHFGYSVRKKKAGKKPPLKTQKEDVSRRQKNPHEDGKGFRTSLNRAEGGRSPRGFRKKSGSSRRNTSDRRSKQK